MDAKETDNRASTSSEGEEQVDSKTVETGLKKEEISPKTESEPQFQIAYYDTDSVVIAVKIPTEAGKVNSEGNSRISPLVLDDLQAWFDTEKTIYPYLAKKKYNYPFRNMP